MWQCSHKAEDFIFHTETGLLSHTLLYFTFIYFTFLCGISATETGVFATETGVFATETGVFATETLDF